MLVTNDSDSVESQIESSDFGSDSNKHTYGI